MSEDSKQSVRCKACDSLFETHWIPHLETHEDMCYSCIEASAVVVDYDQQDLDLWSLFEDAVGGKK